MKTSNNLKGLHQVMTAGNLKKRSIPSVKSSSSALALYVFELEKERLTKECIRMKINVKQISQRLEEIDQNVKSLHEDANKKAASSEILSDSNNPEEKATGNELKKMSFEY